MNRIGRIVQVALAVVVSASVGGAVAVSAQGNNPLDQILAKLDEILATLTPQAGSVKVSSAPMLLQVGTDVYCLISNLGTENVEALAQLLDDDGTQLVGSVLDVPPGHSTGIVATSVNFALRRCQFTFDGPASSVRTQVQLINAQGVSFAEMR